MDDTTLPMATATVASSQSGIHLYCSSILTSLWAAPPISSSYDGLESGKWPIFRQVRHIFVLFILKCISLRDFTWHRQPRAFYTIKAIGFYYKSCGGFKCWRFTLLNNKTVIFFRISIHYFILFILGLSQRTPTLRDNSPPSLTVDWSGSIAIQVAGRRLYFDAEHGRNWPIPASTSRKY